MQLASVSKLLTCSGFGAAGDVRYESTAQRTMLRASPGARRVELGEKY